LQAKRSWNRLDRRVQVSVRDPNSVNRLAAIRRVPPTLVADVAFLLKPEIVTEQGESAENWIQRETLKGRSIVAINISKQSLRNLSKQHTGNLPKIHDSLEYISRAIADLAAQAPMISFLLLPHDFREPNSDYSLLENLNENLSSRGLSSYIVTQGIGPKDIKRLLGLCDLLFTGRMHAAIAAAGAQTPVLALGYLDKFEGLFEMLGIPSDVVDTSRLDGKDPKRLANIMRNGLNNSSVTRETLSDTADSIKKLAVGNFANI